MYKNMVSHDCFTKEDNFLEEWILKIPRILIVLSSNYIDVKQGDKLISIAMRHKGFKWSKKDLSLILGHRSYFTRS